MCLLLFFFMLPRVVLLTRDRFRVELPVLVFVSFSFSTQFHQELLLPHCCLIIRIVLDPLLPFQGFSLELSLELDQLIQIGTSPAVLTDFEGSASSFLLLVFPQCKSLTKVFGYLRFHFN